MDDGNGFYFMRTREYSANMMRFIQKDRVLLGTVLNSQSLNRYSYVEGDPIRGIDPMGAWFLGDDAIVSSIGALVEVAKQVVSDIAEGKVSSLDTYVAAAVKGATKAEVLLYTANAGLAEAAGTFASEVTKDEIKVARGEKEEVDFKGALKKAALSAVKIFDPTKTKAISSMDEALNEVKKSAVANIKKIAPKITKLLEDKAQSKIKSNIKKQAVDQNKDVKFIEYK